MNLSNIKEKATILLVDDNHINLAILESFLSHHGYEITLAYDGQEAVDMARSISPDIILLDIMMPGIDGFTTCEKLKNDPKTKDIPVIFITALSQFDNKIKGFDVGAVDYITKPFHREEVLARINTHLTIQHQKNQLMELNALKDHFLSVIATDMKYVFNMVLGPSRLLAESAGSFSAKEIETFANRLHNAVLNYYQRLEKISDWARLKKESMAFHPKHFDLYELFPGILTLFDDQVKEKQLRINHFIQPETFLYADPNMVDTVFQNILSNAVKNTPIGGNIQIYAKPDNQFTKIEITDTGIGMDEKQVNGLFSLEEPPRDHKTAGQGVRGLGLLLSRELLEKNGGTITIESEPDKGTSVKFTLPAREPIE